MPPGSFQGALQHCRAHVKYVHVHTVGTLIHVDTVDRWGVCHVYNLVVYGLGWPQEQGMEPLTIVYALLYQLRQDTGR